MKLTDEIRSPSVLEELFNDLIMEWNQKVNLVSRRKPNVYDLINDSKLFFDYIDFHPGIKILDLGTGGGFPGVIIKIHHPEIQLTLVDSISKKVKAVKDIISKLGLEGIDVVCSRAEDMPKLPRYKNKFEYIVARSVTMLDDLVRWSKGLVKTGGKLVTLKGSDISEEISRAKKFNYVKNIEVLTKEGRQIVVVKFKAM